MACPKRTIHFSLLVADSRLDETSLTIHKGNIESDWNVITYWRWSNGYVSKNMYTRSNHAAVYTRLRLIQFPVKDFYRDTICPETDTRCRRGVPCKFWNGAITEFCAKRNRIQLKRKIQFRFISEQYRDNYLSLLPSRLKIQNGG